MLLVKNLSVDLWLLHNPLNKYPLSLHDGAICLCVSPALCLLVWDPLAPCGPLQPLGEWPRFSFTMTLTTKENNFFSKTLMLCDSAMKVTEACAYDSFLVNFS